VVFHHPISRDPRCEEQVALASAVSPVPKRKIPQPQVDKRHAVRAIQLPKEISRRRIECIDCPVTKISHQEIVSKTTEASRRTGGATAATLIETGRYRQFSSEEKQILRRVSLKSHGPIQDR
jgi:hypothetical protein